MFAAILTFNDAFQETFTAKFRQLIIARDALFAYFLDTGFDEPFSHAAANLRCRSKQSTH